MTRQSGKSLNTTQSITRSLSDGAYNWNLRCWSERNESDEIFNQSNSTFRIMKVPPTVNVSPSANGTYSNGTTTAITVTTTGNVDDCLIYTDGNINITNRSVTGTQTYNFAFNTGTHTYRAQCNNSAGSTNISNTHSQIVDTTLPAAFNCSRPLNNTRQSDNTPTFSWQGSSDTNFDSYTLHYSTSLQWGFFKLYYRIFRI